MRTTPVGVLTAGFFFLLPFFVLPGLFYTDVNSKFFLTIAYIDIVLVSAAFYLYSFRGGVSVKAQWMLGALGLFLISTYLSVWVGVFPERSLWSDIFWSTGTVFITHLVAVSIALAYLLTAHDWQLVRRAITASVGILSGLSILGVNGMGALSTILWIPLAKGSLTLGNETYIGAYLVLGLVVACIELCRAPRWSRWWYFSSATIGLVMLSPLITNYALLMGVVSVTTIVTEPFQVLGLARASSAAAYLLLIFLAGYFLLRRYGTHPYIRIAPYVWGGLLLGMVAVGVSLLFTPGSLVQEKYIEESTAARIIVWDSARAAIQERPVLGSGPENFGLAVESHFDTRLFYDENNNEIWFERGHNAFIDTLVTTGIVGLLVFMLLIGAYYVAAYRAYRHGRIGEGEMAVLFAFPCIHLVQMQTGFDTVGSYVLLSALGSYVLWHEVQMGAREYVMPATMRKVVAGALCLGAVASIGGVVGSEYSRQRALYESFNPTNPSLQKQYLEASLVSTSSFETLRLSSSSFILGSLDVLEKRATPERIQAILDTAAVYDARYAAYLAQTPDHYRARMNYVYLMLIETSLGRDRIAEAKELVQGSYHLSPGNPITPVLDAMVELYGGNLTEANRLMDKALALDPNVRFTQQVAAYLKRQEQKFPSLDILTLSNL